MATSSRSHKPSEWAAKVNHTHLIKDPFIQNFLKNCSPPKKAYDIDANEASNIHQMEDVDNPIKYIFAVDGGYTTVQIEKSFPSSEIAFFQFGALLFKQNDLDDLSEKPFIFPEDMQKLNNLSRFKLAIPIKNITTSNETTLTHSLRKTLYDFFMESRESSSFMETLNWFLFEQYKSKPKSVYTLSNDPNLEAGTGQITLSLGDMKPDYTFNVGNGTIYLTDVFRLHEAVDDEQGAGGILGYLTRLIEQMILVHFIRIILKKKPSLLNNFLFITDGPLSFAGQTANMHKPMRSLCNYIIERNDTNLFLVGLEKSGAFVDHSREICQFSEKKPFLEKNSFLLLSNEYIYKYVIPGDFERMHYGSTSYYSAKVIYHSLSNQIITLSVPVKNKDVIKSPQLCDYQNIMILLKNIEKLRCDMYDDSIVPIALANKLVSLANHPSKILLEKFATSNISK